jgi:hypothetical protein
MAATSSTFYTASHVTTAGGSKCREHKYSDNATGPQQQYMVMDEAHSSLLFCNSKRSCLYILTYCCLVMTRLGAFIYHILLHSYVSSEVTISSVAAPHSSSITFPGRLSPIAQQDLIILTFSNRIVFLHPFYWCVCLFNSHNLHQVFCGVFLHPSVDLSLIHFHNLHLFWFTDPLMYFFSYNFRSDKVSLQW